MTIADIFLYFIFFSFVGWFWEGLISIVRDHKIINRGFLNGPYCPIYGAGALLFYFICQHVDNPIIIFFTGGVVACALEYLTSYLMEKIFKARWWSYEDYPFNLNGRICLYGFLIFGAAAILTSYIGKPTMDFIAQMNYKIELATVLAAIFIIDIFSTTKSFAKFNKLLREYQATLGKGRIAQIIQRGRRRFEVTFIDKPRKVLTYQQRRLLKAFPKFESRYNIAFYELKNFYKKTKYQPKKQNAHARKKSKKILK
ncbi:hypothetical protein IKG13_01115 [Candidatus Saccharibacteria bacterium]|nr:hypothetical protein [Candidatus Saccharibacteria bacterium]